MSPHGIAKADWRSRLRWQIQRGIVAIFMYHGYRWVEFLEVNLRAAIVSCLESDVLH